MHFRFVPFRWGQRPCDGRCICTKQFDQQRSADDDDNVRRPDEQLGAEAGDKQANAQQLQQRAHQPAAEEHHSRRIDPEAVPAESEHRVDQGPGHRDEPARQQLDGGAVRSDEQEQHDGASDRQLSR